MSGSRFDKPSLPITDVMTYGAVAISCMTCFAFFGAILVAYFAKDQANLSMFYGVVAASFSNVVGFWIGSSVGSRQKDETKRPG